MIKTKHKRLLTFLASLFFIASVLFLCRIMKNTVQEPDVQTFLETQNLQETKNSTEAQKISESQNENQVQTKTPDNTSADKMTGVWVPYMDLDMSLSNGNNEKKFKEKFQNIITEAKKFGINAVIVHVRSHGDAMYPSKIFPWSHLITGTQGTDPGFDPLSYMIKTAHENGLKFHAWINPLRIQTKTYPKKLSPDNPYFKLGSEKYFIKHTDGICYNPAYTETRKLIIDGVKEIVQNYNVDGIHFDDYFYPEEKNFTSKDCAYDEQLKSGEKKLSLQDWRKKNINSLVSETYKSIKAINSNVLFGISPAGNMEKCHEAGADVNLWASNKGYVDYLCPQIYWSLDYSEMPFEKTAVKWKNILKSNNVKLYSGLALYKAGTDADKSTWKSKNNILASEFKIIQKLNYDGMILYSWSFLNNPSTKEETDNLQKEMNIINK